MEITQNGEDYLTCLNSSSVCLSLFVRKAVRRVEDRDTCSVSSISPSSLHHYPLTLGLIERTKLGAQMSRFIQTNVGNSLHRTRTSAIHLKITITFVCHYTHTHTYTRTNNDVCVCVLVLASMDSSRNCILIVGASEFPFALFAFALPSTMCTAHTHTHLCTSVMQCMCKSYAFLRIHSIRKS